MQKRSERSMKLKSPKLPPGILLSPWSSCPGQPGQSPQSPLTATRALLHLTHHSTPLLPRPPPCGTNPNSYHRGRLKRDLSGTQILIRRPGNPSSSNLPNQWFYPRFLSDIHDCIEDHCSNHSLDRPHLRGRPSRLSGNLLLDC